jgi:Predicted membrane protein
LFADVGLPELHRNHTQQVGAAQPPVAQPPVAEPVPAREVTTAPLQNPAPVAKAPVADERVVKAPDPIPPAAEAPATKPQDDQVAAKPEILSPRDFAPAGPANPKLDPSGFSAWNDKDVHVLPSRRGQYGSH